MSIFSNPEEKRKEEERRLKVLEWKKKCNFLGQKWGTCKLTDSYASYMDCSFEDCIFMKMVSQMRDNEQEKNG